jgi:Tlde1 domain
MGAIGVNGPARFFRRAFDQKLASFDERFAGGEIFGAEKGQRKQCTQPCTLAAARSGGARIAKACIGRFVTASERRKKRVATAEASKDSISPADEYNRTAIYDIAARTVYLPNGRRLEAHSGLGSHMDDARFVNLKRLGPTPPNTYKLVMREEPFHGVRAIRLVPILLQKSVASFFGR